MAMGAGIDIVVVVLFVTYCCCLVALHWTLAVG